MVRASDPRMWRTRRWVRATVALVVAASVAVAAPSERSLAQAGELGADWHRVAHDEAAFGGDGEQIPTDVIATADGFVAIGADSAGPLVQPAMWRSADGRSWERASLDAAFADPAVARLPRALATNGDTIVTIGVEGIGCVDNFAVSVFGVCATSTPMAWASTDGGATWTQGSGAFTTTGDSTATDVVATSDGFYMLVNERIQASWTAEIWFSDTGTSWERIHTVDSPFPVNGRALAVDGDIVYAYLTHLVGTEIQPRQATQAGGGWVAIAIEGVEQDPALLGLAGSVDDGFPLTDLGSTAQYANFARSPLAYATDDGQAVFGPAADDGRSVTRWTPGGEPSTTDTVVAPSATGRQFTHLTETADGLLVVDFQSDADGVRVAAWTSADQGDTWTALDSAGADLDRINVEAQGAAGRIEAIAASGDVAVAVGTDSSGGDVDAAFFYSDGTVPATGGDDDDGEPATDIDAVTPLGCGLTSAAICPAPNLDGAVLTGVSVDGADLELGNFAGADLEGADLSGADLTAADFSGANLRGADLRGAMVEAASFVGADLTFATLTDIEAAGADFSGAIMQGVDATNTNFSAFGAGAIFVEADLSEAILVGADFGELDMTGAFLFQANLAGANFAGARLDGASFEEAIVTEARISGASLRDANLSALSGRSLTLTQSDLRGANLTGADLTNASLFGVDFDNGSLADATLVNANLLEAILTGVDFAGADLSGAEWGSTLCPDGTATGAFPSAPCSVEG